MIILLSSVCYADNAIIEYQTPNHKIILDEDGVEIDGDFKTWAIQKSMFEVGIAGEYGKIEKAVSNSCIIIDKAQTSHFLGLLAREKHKMRWKFTANRVIITEEMSCSFIFIPESQSQVKTLNPEDDEEKLLTILNHLTN